MNNVKKFEETKKALKVFQKELVHFEEEAEKKLEEEGIESKKYFTAFLTSLRSKELSINKRRNLIMLESLVFGSFAQPIQMNKRRMNVIPLCFLIHLYKEDLEVKEMIDEEQTDIPFTLRGFWKMDKAVELVNALVSFQIDSAVIIEKQIEENSTKNSRVKKLKQILEVVESLEIFVFEDLYEIHFDEKVFKVNKKNRKLDMVPLCKMITSYYVRIVNYIQDYKKMLGATDDKQDICEIQDNFMNLIKKYFILYIVRC